MSVLRRGIGIVQNNWRITLLIVLIAISTYFLFVPGAPFGDEPGLEEDGERGLTNLQYGIELAGGARIRAPVYGYTAEDVSLDPDETTEVTQALAESLGIDERDIRVDDEGQTIEVFDRDVSEDEFEQALTEYGFDSGEFSIRPGVTDATRSDIIATLNERLGEAGFQGGTARQITGPGGTSYVSVESPGRDIDDLRQIIGERGDVRVIAHYSTDDGYEEEVALRQDNLADIGTVSWNDQRERYEVPVSVESGDVEDFLEIMERGGYDQQGGTFCDFDAAEENDSPTRPDDGWGGCLLIEVDDEIIAGYGVSSGLAEDFRTSDFAMDPVFVISVHEHAEAEMVRINLVSGALAAQINVEDATTMNTEPALAENFRQNALLTGIFAILAVVMMVFLRYGDPRVAAPMSVTALSELYILLGFAAAVGLSLDLSHIAGFIAVVGTGVDDLIIIADEVMGDTDVRSQLVFDSRFRKAFWVIGAAAATTIIAMSPLAILSLGDLRGFAIVTILGVLIGVFITRPAYGNILRMIKTEK